jgi:uncharacterized RDD family membrane protein YckC
MENETIQTTTVTYGGFWRRVLAYLLDGFVITILTSIVIGLSGTSPEVWKSGYMASQDFFYFMHNAPLSYGVMWLYYALMESSKYQATLGKMATEMIVTKEDGSKITFKDATVRFFSKILSCIILGIGFLMIIWNKKKQGLHDKLAGTIVVRK